MPPIIRIPDRIYARLALHAEPFDTPIKTIEKILDRYEEGLEGLSSELYASKVTVLISSKRSKNNTVKDWRDCVEITMGYRKGTTHLENNSDFIRRIYEKFCEGEPAFGVSGTNAMEAILEVIRDYEHDKLELALEALGRSIEQGDKPFVKMKRMLDRVRNESVG